MSDLSLLTDIEEKQSDSESKPVEDTKKIELNGKSSGLEDSVKKDLKANIQKAEKFEECKNSKKNELLNETEDSSKTRIESDGSSIVSPEKNDEVRNTDDDSSSNIKLEDSNENSEQAVFYEQELSRLRSIISLQNTDYHNLEMKLIECEQQAKQKCEELEQNFTLKLEQTLKSFKEGQNEKTSSLVMKYAQGEKKCIELNRNIELLKSKLDDSNKDKQRLNEKFERSKLDKEKLNIEYEKKILEIMLLKKEVVKLKEVNIVAEAREQSSTSKWKLECQAHAACKELLEEANIKIESFKSNNEKIEINDAEFVSQSEESDKNSTEQTPEKDNQETNEIGDSSSYLAPNLSNGSETSPAKTSPKKLSPLKKSPQDDRNLKELHALKSQLKDMFEERTSLRDSLQCMDKERKLQESSLTKFKETLQSQKQMNKDLLTEILQLRELQETLTNEKTEKTNLEQKIKVLTEELKEVQEEMESGQKKQNELLSFTSKLTEKNTILQSENTTLSEKLKKLEIELSEKNEHYKQSEIEMRENSNKLTNSLEEESSRNKLMSAELEKKRIEIEELKVKLSDEQSENVSLKKKHQANVRDLSRQLQLLQKKVSTSNTAPSSTVGTKNIKTSRTNSISSLNDKDGFLIDSNNSGNMSNYSLNDETRSLNETPNLQRPSSFNEVICGNDDVYVVDVDKQKIIEKIVKLQKLLAKRNEKIDFLQDHVNQLTIDVKRKTKIIQAYAMNEPEVGAFTSEAQDAIKREMSKKTGHMSTLYNTNKSYVQTAQFINSNESHMTKDLCLEINGKLQALLEDTLIKNLTLKDSIETLGTEIARLSKENRNIALKNN